MHAATIELLADRAIGLGTFLLDQGFCVSLLPEPAFDSLVRATHLHVHPETFEHGFEQG
nr:hypothetical protein [Pseudomonas glycinae]